MRSIAKISLFTFSFLLLLVLNSASFAAPVRVTSGTVRPNPGTIAPNGLVQSMSFRFAGDDIMGGGGNGGQPPLGNLSGCQVNCVAGDIVSPNALITTGTPAFSGRVTYQGNLYEVIQASFSFSGESSVLTDIFDNTNPNFGVQRFSLPFVMTGTLDLRSLSASIPDRILEITGTGFVNISYVDARGIPGSTDPNTSGMVRIEYVFDGIPTPIVTPEPVPEPTTLLLFGAGLAGIGGYAKRKRKLKNSE